MKVRAFFGLVVVASILLLANCGHYTCGATFGASSCTASGSGIGSGGGGSATAAFVFAVDTSSGTMDGYTLDTTANTLSATTGYTAPTIPQDTGAGMVVAQGKYLYAAFRSTNQIFGWQISSSGGLTAVTGSPYSASFLSSINAGGLAQQNMITNPAGTLLFFSDPLTSEIFVYQIGSGGALTAASGSPFAAPFGPLNLATDGKGRYLYAVNDFYGNHTGTEIAAFSIGSSGSLTSVPGSPFAFPMWQVAGEPSGNFLIGTSGNSVPSSGRDDNHLYVFSINQTTGALTEVSGSPFTAQFSPLTIAVQPNTGGNLVYSFGVNDTDTGYNGIEGFQISSTGTLTEINGSPFTNIQLGYWGQLDQKGQFLFDYSAIVNTGTNTIVTTLGALSVGSGGAITESVSPVTLVTQGYWVVTDAP
jgi:6-phosphogluconolactonase (cycloisomerase 2 family)